MGPISQELDVYGDQVIGFATALGRAYVMLRAYNDHPWLPECVLGASSVLSSLEMMEDELRTTRVRLGRKIEWIIDGMQEGLVMLSVTGGIEVVRVEFKCGHDQDIKMRIVSDEQRQRAKAVMKTRNCFCCASNDVPFERQPRPFAGSWKGRPGATDFPPF
jgi:hypothetical protein